MKLSVRTAAVAGAIVVAGITTGCGSDSTAASATGTEKFSGTELLTAAQAASNSFEPTIPLAASGLFAGTGSIHLGNGNEAGPSSIILKDGDVNVHHAATNPNLPLKPVGALSSCVYGITEQVAYTVTGGTGSYKGITSGRGTATVTYDVDIPKMAGGKCANPGTATPTGGVVTFKAVGPITLLK